MKKLFTILALLALLMVPCISMAATMSDSELAAITGAGVEIAISPLTIGISLDSMTWGDYNVNGFTGNSVTYNQTGGINILPLAGTMHVLLNGITAYAAGNAANGNYDLITNGDLVVDINVGTVGGTPVTASTGQYYVIGGTSAVQMGFANGVHFSLDGFVADIVLDSTNAPYTDWKMAGLGATSGHPGAGGALYTDAAAFNTITSLGTGGDSTTLAPKTLGVFGISGLNVNVTGQGQIPFYVTISAH